MSENALSIREAIADDIPRLQNLLTGVGLLADDILVSNTRYWLAQDEHAHLSELNWAWTLSYSVAPPSIPLFRVKESARS